MSENERTLHSATVIPSSPCPIYDLCHTLTLKLLSDDEIKQLAADAYAKLDLESLLFELHTTLSDSKDSQCYNRYTQANTARFTLCLLEKITQKPDPSPPPTESFPFAYRAGRTIWHILRYPVFLFAQLFGYLNNIVTTYTSLDRSFWGGIFVHARPALFITLPLDLIFIGVTLIQYRLFEVSYLKMAMGLSHQKEIDPNLIADRTAIKVARLLNEHLILLRNHKLLHKDKDLSLPFSGLAHTLSHIILDKKQHYATYTQPRKQKIIRWGFNLIGAFLVSCFTAFSFKYTAMAFVSSKAVVAWLPWLAAGLAIPAVMTAMTIAAVASALIYYASKRSNSPDHYFHKFRHNKNKLDSFKKCWYLQEKNRMQQEACVRSGILAEGLIRWPKVRQSYKNVISELKRNRPALSRPASGVLIAANVSPDEQPEAQSPYPQPPRPHTSSDLSDDDGTLTPEDRSNALGCAGLVYG